MERIIANNEKGMFVVDDQLREQLHRLGVEDEVQQDDVFRVLADISMSALEDETPGDESKA